MVRKGIGSSAVDLLPKMYGDETVYIMILILTVLILVGQFGLTIMGVHAVYMIRLPIVAKLSAGILIAAQAVSGVATIVRLVYTIKIHNLPLSSSIAEGILSSQWSSVEIGLGIITANLALTRPAFVLLYRKLFAKQVPVATLRSTVPGSASKSNGWDFNSRASFEITKTQVITVINEDVNLGEYEGMGRAGLIGDSWGVEVMSRA